eukprot:12491332-Heterocapsa_arctica.AAC.1
MEPSRPPPSEETVSRLRELVGAALDLSPAEVEAHHPASCWRFRIVQVVLERTEDPDALLREWLEHGCPAGIAQAISPGGHFPRVNESVGLSEEEMSYQYAGNRPSFSSHVPGD